MSKNEILYKSAFMLLLKILSGVLGLAMFILISKTTTSVDYAEITFLYSFVFVSSTLFSAGIPTFIIKKFPGNLDNQEIISSLNSFVFLITGSFSLLGAVLVGLFFPVSKFGVGPIILFFVLCILNTYVSLLRVYGYVFSAVIWKDVVWKLIVIALITLLCFSEMRMFRLLSSEYIVFFIAISLLTVFKLQTYIVYKNGLFRFLSLKNGASHFSDWIRPCIAFALSSFIISTDSYIFTILSRYVYGEGANITSLFFNTSRIVELIGLFLISIALVIAPKLSKAIADNDFKLAQIICNIAVLVQLIPCIIAIIFLYISGEYVLSFFSLDMSGQSSFLIIVAIGTLINSCFGMTGLVLQLIDRHWEYVLFQVLGLLSAIVVLFTLSDYIMYQALAYSFVVYKATWNILAWSKIKSETGIDTSIFSVLSGKTFDLNSVTTMIKSGRW